MALEREGGGGRSPDRRSGVSTTRFVALLIALALVGPPLWQWWAARAERAAYPKLSGELSVPGLDEPLRILRDRWGIPHASAASERDAYFALGFAHAQDRPIQLLWWRSAARGELASWIGAEALPGDRIARGLGLAVRAEARWADSSDRVRRLLEAYSAGINAVWAAFREGETARPANWPRADVPVWGPEDSIAVLGLYAWSLEGTLEETLVLGALLERFGGLESRVFFPHGATSGEARRAQVPGLRPARGFAQLRRALGMAGASIGSSAVVLSGERSASGAPLLIADSHTEATQPAAWYRAHLEAPGFRVAGATLPGIPVFWTGFTEGVAWASTYPGAVVSDVYVETLQDAKDRYHDGRRWRSLAVREESIAVRDAEPVSQRVRETRHGPLISDFVEGSMPPLALSWLGIRDGHGLEGFFGAARAADADALREALGAHRHPVVRVSYVATGGEAGSELFGAVPTRPQFSELLPFPGRDRSYDWAGVLTSPQLRAAYPGRAAPTVVAADGAGATGGLVEWLWAPGERERRLRELLGGELERGAPALDSLLGLQSDVVTRTGVALIEKAVAEVRDRDDLPPEARECLRVLRAWEGRSGPESPGAALFHVFQRHLLERLLGKTLGDDLLRRYVSLRRMSVGAFLTRLADTLDRDPKSVAWIGRAHFDEAVAEALRDAWVSLSVELGRNRDKWQWGKLHGLRFRTLWPLAAYRGGPGPFAYGGSSGSVQVADYAALGPYDVRTVAGHRFGVDAADLSHARSALAPGQSEFPGHPHAEDGIRGWLRGEDHLFTAHGMVVDTVTGHELRLKPVP